MCGVVIKFFGGGDGLSDGLLDVFDGVFSVDGEYEEMKVESEARRDVEPEEFSVPLSGERAKAEIGKVFDEFEVITMGVPLSAKQENFLRAFVRCKNLTKARTIAGVSSAQYQGWMKSKTDFSRMVGEVTDMVADSLEDVALDMALSGNEKMLIKMLEAYRPEKFSPKRAIDVKTDSKVTLNVNSWEELAKKALLDSKGSPELIEAVDVVEEEVRDGKI